MMNETLKKQIELLPDQPGCYLMHNADDEIIYIGKAKNLKKRVSQYFLRVHSGKTAAIQCSRTADATPYDVVELHMPSDAFHVRVIDELMQHVQLVG